MALLLTKLKTFMKFHRLSFKNWCLAVITKRRKLSQNAELLVWLQTVDLA